MSVTALFKVFLRDPTTGKGVNTTNPVNLSVSTIKLSDGTFSNILTGATMSAVTGITGGFTYAWTGSFDQSTYEFMAVATTSGYGDMPAIQTGVNMTQWGGAALPTSFVANGGTLTDGRIIIVPGTNGGGTLTVGLNTLVIPPNMGSLSITTAGQMLLNPAQGDITFASATFTNGLTASGVYVANNISVGNDIAVVRDISVERDLSIIGDLAPGQILTNLLCAMNGTITNNLVIGTQTISGVRDYAQSGDVFPLVANATGGIYYIATQAVAAATQAAAAAAEALAVQNATSEILTAATAAAASGSSAASAAAGAQTAANAAAAGTSGILSAIASISGALSPDEHAALMATSSYIQTLNSGDIIFHGPVLSGGTLNLIPGDDYRAADSRQLDLPFAGAPSLTGATVTLIVGAMSVTGTVTDASHVRFQPTAADTIKLPRNTTLSYVIHAVLADASIATIAAGIVNTKAGN